MNSIVRHTFLLFILGITFVNVYSQGWMQLNTSGTITPRSNASAVYDPSSNRMIVIGGLTANGIANDIWSLDINTNVWSQIIPVSLQAPAPRYTHICMFDSLTNKILMWSGNGNVLYNDVWAFNLNDSTWEELFPDGNVPGAPLKRYGVATTFDPANRNIVTFAGFTTSGRFDDTWIFNVDSQTWSDVTNLSFPLLRCLTSQSFAPERREMIVYGGQSTGNLDDIWTLNTDSNTWTNLTPVQKPIARHYPSNVYCGNGHVVIFGGNSLNQGNTNGALDDLWTFSLDSQSWDTLPQGSIKPSPRFGHTYIYIPSQDKMIIFGGQGLSSMNSETWVYTGVSSLLNTIEERENNFFSLNCLPNPSTGNFSINFILAEKSEVTIDLFDCMGKNIFAILNKELLPGKQEINFSGNNLSPGIYLCTLKTNSFFESIRIVIIESN